MSVTKTLTTASGRSVTIRIVDAADAKRVSFVYGGEFRTFVIDCAWRTSQIAQAIYGMLP